jgi:KUP system potassium uptake protein
MQTPAQEGMAHTTSQDAPANHEHRRFFALALGSVGVVFGDIGTSPLYALRESLAHVSHGGVATRAEVIGIVSLILWSLMLIVTGKYITFMMRADNRGEGGMLSLLALVQRALAKRSRLLTGIAIAGAALFYADGIITPAISVLSAVEGLSLVTPAMSPMVVPIALLILVALFAVQARGTGSVARWFGPVTALWFLTLAAMGLMHIADDPEIFKALDPRQGFAFLLGRGMLGFIVLGSVFLAVTGAEALYADMGHFGRGPIRAAWLLFVMPCLVLHYIGQGAFVLATPSAFSNPFFLMVPEELRLPLVLLATAATVIASQAVITGAFSMTQQAIQLGLLPRMEVRFTSETQAGQIYVPKVNRLLFIGVIALVLMFGSSSRLASAYGIAVTGAMVLDTLLFAGFLLFVWRWKPVAALALIIPILAIELAFFAANALKLFEGGFVPVLVAIGLGTVMLTWVRGTRILAEKTKRETVPMTRVMRSLGKVQRVPGTAVFLTSDLEAAPQAMMHNLKHNKVLHETNVLVRVAFAETPRVPKEDRLSVERTATDMWRMTVTYGYMDRPNVPAALARARDLHGLPYDIMSTSFFLGRRSLRRDPKSEMPVWQDKLFLALAHDASAATDFFHIPTDRVVELGTQILI